MLRPAYLLPDARLLPRLGLSIPRSGRRNLFRRLGPAIRCFGAYRLGTLTRWRTAASVRELRLLRGILLFRVTTHHADILRQWRMTGRERAGEPSSRDDDGSSRTHALLQFPGRFRRLAFGVAL